MAWKLDFVLMGRAGDALLDSYGVERGAHVRRLTTTIKGIGRNICERDPAQARARDADLLAQAGGTVKSVPRQDLIPPLEVGLLSPRAHAANGTLFPQPMVAHQGRTGLLDDIAGAGLRLITRDAAALPAPHSTLPALHAAPARVIHIGASESAPVAGAMSVIEADNIVTRWFARHDACAALVRPDHYVYGVAATPEEIEPLIAEFNNMMETTR